MRRNPYHPYILVHRPAKGREAEAAAIRSCGKPELQVREDAADANSCDIQTLNRWITARFGVLPFHTVQ